MRKRWTKACFEVFFHAVFNFNEILDFMLTFEIKPFFFIIYLSRIDEKSKMSGIFPNFPTGISNLCFS